MGIKEHIRKRRHKRKLQPAAYVVVLFVIILCVAGFSMRDTKKQPEKRLAEEPLQAEAAQTGTMEEETAEEQESREQETEETETPETAAASVNETVSSYEWLVQEYADQNGIGEYTPLLLAIMMVESEGFGDDPMATAESPFNTGEQEMNPDYSIQCGVLELKSTLEEAGCTSTDDIDAISLALQGYNYGNDYVSWALNNYGGYTADNAWEFSYMMCYKLGWSSYGDPRYVQKVLQYYRV